MISLVACLFVFCQSKEISEENKAAIAYLQKYQMPSGGFVAVLPPQGEEGVTSLRTTRTALRAFKLLGGSPANTDSVHKYLMACYDEKSGGFSDRPGVAPDPISTSVGIMILGELQLPNDKYLERALRFMAEKTEGFEQIRMVASGLEETGKRFPQADDWLKIIDKARNADGSYGNGPGLARTTALYVVAQQRLGGKPESAEAVLKILRAGQRKDGGFGGEKEGESDLESCYRIVRLFSRLEAKPDRTEDLRKFIARCRNKDGGFAVQPGKPSSLHGTYYATIIRYWLDGGKNN
jgi:prenyltransferase beta subunit